MARINKHERKGIKGRVFGITSGMRGFLISCARNQEARSTSEAINILESISTSVEHKEDFFLEGSEKKFESYKSLILEEVKSLRDLNQRVFHSIPLGEVECMVFIKTSNETDPVQMTNILFSEKNGNKSSRFCQRFIPLTEIFKASISGLRSHALNLVSKSFSSQGNKIPTVF